MSDNWRTLLRVIQVDGKVKSQMETTGQPCKGGTMIYNNHCLEVFYLLHKDLSYIPYAN